MKREDKGGGEIDEGGRGEGEGEKEGGGIERKREEREGAHLTCICTF